MLNLNTHQDPGAALEVLVRALGLDRGAAVFTGRPDIGFHYPDEHKPS